MGVPQGTCKKLDESTSRVTLGKKRQTFSKGENFKVVRMFKKISDAQASSPRETLPLKV